MTPWPARWRLPSGFRPSLQPLRAAGARLPLPITATVILLLLVGPSVVLLRWPRPRAQGLEQLMATATLVQSFPATPDRPVPALWSERLGAPLAERVWRRQRRTWWQFWGGHAAEAPYLALPAATLPPGGLPATAHSQKVGDLLVLAPDPLSRQLLADRLQPGLRPAKGLRSRCLALIEREQAVFWNPDAVGVIAGLVAPFLQRFQEGCLALRLDPQGVRWQGEAAASDGVLHESSPIEIDAPPPVRPALPDDLLLEVDGSSLRSILDGLLAREVIRAPLATFYGIDARRLNLLRDSRFRLRLRSQPRGDFRAALQLQVVVGKRGDTWRQVLTSLAATLRKRGLTTAAPGRKDTDAPAADATWRRQDGVVVGGWRWLDAAKGEPELLFFLGPSPSLPLPITAVAKARPQGLLLRARPEALNALGLLPAEMPPLVKSSSQLWMEAAPLPGDGAGQPVPVSRLSGALQVKR